MVLSNSITVSISRLWNTMKQGIIQMTAILICVDYHEEQFEVHVPARVFESQKAILSEGDVYKISNFMVLQNFRRYRFTTHPYYIQLTPDTTIIKLDDFSPFFPVHHFSPQSYNQLINLATPTTYLPDVVGQIRLMLNLGQNDSTNESKITVGLMLNSTQMVKLYLWGKQAANFRSLQQVENRKLEVVVITSVIPTIYRGTFELASSLGTKFYFDPTIEYIKHYKGRIRI